ncbi:MAG: imidazole glycerol phosphate synthase subunit HisH [Candidatus Limnocylindrales bacterium]
MTIALGGSPDRADPAEPAVTVAIVDHGAGNLVSIAQALEIVGARPVLAAAPEELERADLVVLPGVGAAAPAMARLEERALADPLRDWIAADRPFLGICLGLQLLFDASDEDGATTLGVFAGRTVPLVEAPTLPHIGWNQVERRREHPIFEGIADGVDLYFVHSYVVRPAREETDIVLAETEHGERFVSAVARGRCLGVQFHPERSGLDGLRLLENVVRLAAASRTRTAALGIA